MVIILIITLLIVADQAVKYWAWTALSQIGTIPIIQNVFHLTYVENYGAAFSILQNQRWFFLIITPIILIFLCLFLYRQKVHTKCGKIGIYLVISGAIGNLIDRVWHGFVVDLFDFRLIQFPVFNLADIYVVCGVLLFFYYYLIQHDKAGAEHE